MSSAAKRSSGGAAPAVFPAVLLLTGLLSLCASAALAQPRAAHLAAPRGRDVTGLEIAIEGAVRAIPGGRLRWFVTVYEVRGGRDLVPAAGASVVALASYHRALPVAELRTDSEGRALLSLDLPERLGSGFQLLLRASAGGFQREFQSQITVQGASLAAQLWLDRTHLSAGDELHAFGRIVDLRLGRPVANAPLDLRIGGHSPQRIQSDGDGFFSASARAPRRPGAFAVEATPILPPLEIGEPERRGRSASVGAEVATAPDPPDLLVEATPERRVAAPGDRVEVRVQVRTPQGHPVAGAILRGLSLPERDEEGQRVVVRTDARGRATLPFELPRAPSGPAVDAAQGQIEALRAGLGTGRATVEIRTARGDRFFGWAVEGGSFVPELPTRLFVRAVDAEGRPLAGERISLEGPSLGAAEAQTDEEGVAVLESSLSAGGAADPCGGAASTSITLRSGGISQSFCAPVDPDATLRVRAPSVTRPGARLGFRILRRSDLRRAPVIVDLLSREVGPEGSRWVPQERLRLGASEERGEIEVAGFLRGELWIRARPLFGSPARELRGGGALSLALPPEIPGPALSADRSGADAQVRVGLETQGESLPGFLFALPEERGTALIQELHGDLGPAAALLRRGATGARVEGSLASRVPRDLAVAAVLRGGQAIPLHAPSDPVEHGLLRDPWRTRARFVRGRLGRMLRSIEGFLRSRLPDELDRIATPVGGRLRFNAGLVAAIDEELGRESALGLDGEPLSYEALQRLVPELSYDNVAARVTRRHLLEATVSLARFVRERGLDYAWARRGTPEDLRGALVESGELDASSLYDGWGRPLALVPVRARREGALLSPLPGYELSSAGPDGRFGSGDDLRDPFGRVLRSGGVYADAVGEDALLARLRGSSVDRAQIESLATILDISSSEWAEEQEASSDQAWGSEPSLLPEAPLGTLPWLASPPPAAGSFLRLEGSLRALLLALPERPRRYRLVAASFGPEGQIRARSIPLTGGLPVLLEAPLPARLRRGEGLEIEAQLSNVGGPRELRLELRAEGGVRARADLPPEHLEEGESRRFRIRIEGAEVGPARLRLRLLGADGELLLEREQRLFVGEDGSLYARRTGILLSDRLETPIAARIDAPEGSRPVRALLLARTPLALLEDTAARATELSPTLGAWQRSLRGEASRPEELAEARALLVRAAVDRRRARRSGAEIGGLHLEEACALFALRASPETQDSEIRRLLQGRGAPSSLEESAAILAAMATALPPRHYEGEPSEPLLGLLSELRARAWGALAEARESPAQMAKVAAALLLIDRGDAPGRALFQGARAALVRAPGGGQRLRGPDPRTEIEATLALSIAARQLGEDALAGSLLQGAAGRLHLLERASPRSLFWLLAASLYGAFGLEEGSHLELAIDGRDRRVELRAGRARVPLPAAGASLEMRSDGPLLVHLESRYLRPAENRPAAEAEGAAGQGAAPGPLHVELGGDPGSASERSGFEITVRHEGSGGRLRERGAVTEPILEIELPAAARVDERALAAMRAQPTVRSVLEPDGRGLLRLRLRPLEVGATHRLSLPFRWIGATETRSLGLRVYDDQRPWEGSRLPPIPLSISFPERERWQ